jgi:hypothetical protein
VGLGFKALWIMALMGTQPGKFTHDFFAWKMADGFGNIHAQNRFTILA